MGYLNLVSFTSKLPNFTSISISPESWAGPASPSQCQCSIWEVLFGGYTYHIAFLLSFEEALSRYVYLEVVCILPLHQCKYGKHENLAHIIDDCGTYWPHIALRTGWQHNPSQTNSDIPGDQGTRTVFRQTGLESWLCYLLAPYRGWISEPL